MDNRELLPILKLTIARMAVLEWVYFGRNTILIDGRKNQGITEKDNRVFHRIFHYWKYTVDKDFDGKDTNWPWSAVFICYCVKVSCYILGLRNPFKYSSLHSDYVNEAFRNRKGMNIDLEPIYLYGYYRDETPLQVGDLVGFIPSKRGGYLNDRNLHSKKGYNSHFDIVQSISHSRQKASIIGGNVSNSATKMEIAIDKDGFIISNKYFVILRIVSKEDPV